MIRHFRKYEKYIFWGIVIVILPTFSVSWLMVDVFTKKNTNPPVGTLYGKTISSQDFDVVRQRLMSFLHVLGQDRDTRMNFNQITWDHLTFLQKADQAGVEVSDAELADEVKEFYTNQIAGERAAEKVRKEIKPGTNDYMINMMFNAAREEEKKHVEFDAAGYEQLVTSRKWSVGEFEKTLREQMRVQRLTRVVASAAQPTSEDLFELYQDDEQKRKARYIELRPSALAVDAAPPSEDELKAWYAQGQVQFRFRETAKVATEWVAAPLSSFAGKIAPVIDADIEKRYEETKERFYRLPDAPPPAPVPTTGTADAPTPTATVATPRYRPLAEVKDEITRKIRTERLQAAAKASMEAARAKFAPLNVTAPAAIGVTPLEAFARAEGLTYGKTPLQAPETLRDVKEIAFYKVLDMVDQTPPGGLTVADASEESAFFLRVTEKKAERSPPYEEVAARVRSAYVDPTDDELQTYYNRHLMNYREPEKVAIEWLAVDLARAERQVPETVTGDARKAALREKAAARIEDIRTAFNNVGPDGKRRDLEGLAAEKGADANTAIVEKTTGKGLPPQLEGPAVMTRLSESSDKAGELSPTLDNATGTAVVAYRVRQTIPAKTTPIDQARAAVRKDLLAERAEQRTQALAQEIEKQCSPHSALEPVAAKLGLTVRETPFVGRRETIPGIDNASQFVRMLFYAQTLGDVAPPVNDATTKTVYIVRWTEKQAASAAGFAARAKDLREGWMRDAKMGRMPRGHAGAPGLLETWQQDVRLEARGIADAALEEAYELRYGPDGLASIDARAIVVGLDKETIKARLDAKAQADARRVYGELKGGARFDTMARQWTMDEKSQRTGGELGTFKRGDKLHLMTREAEDAIFTAQTGEILGPMKVQDGWALFAVIDHRGDEVHAKEILFKAEQRKNFHTGESEPLDQETRKLAAAVSKKRIEEAARRLAAGEDFAIVARSTLSVTLDSGTASRDASDDMSLAEKRTYDYETEIERAALSLRPHDLSDVVVDKRGAHLLYAEAAREEDRAPGEAASGALAIRQILVGGERGAKKLEGIRAELVEFRKKLEDADEADGGGPGGRSVWLDLVKKVEQLAHDESEAPSATRGGNVGVFRRDPVIVKYGAAFRDAMNATADGATSPVTDLNGEGFAIVRVESRKKMTLAEARADVARALLAGVEF